MARNRATNFLGRNCDTVKATNPRQPLGGQSYQRYPFYEGAAFSRTPILTLWRQRPRFSDYSFRERPMRFCRIRIWGPRPERFARQYRMYRIDRPGAWFDPLDVTTNSMAHAIRPMPKAGALPVARLGSCSASLEWPRFRRNSTKGYYLIRSREQPRRARGAFAKLSAHSLVRAITRALLCPSLPRAAAPFFSPYPPGERFR
jgi:hypothetical protein